MATIISHEFDASIAQDAHMFLSAQTISSEAKESQAFFEREMQLTYRDNSFADDAEETWSMHFVDPVNTLTDGAHEAAESDDRPGMSGAWRA